MLKYTTHKFVCDIQIENTFHSACEKINMVSHVIAPRQIQIPGLALRAIPE
jgi:hypothetical protein